MSSRLAIALGLLLGAAIVVALAIAIVLMSPSPAGRLAASPPIGSSASPDPSAAGSSAGAPATASPSGPAATASPGAASSGPGGSAAGPAPTAAAQPSGTTSVAAAFHVGQPAPSLKVPQVEGGTVDLGALRGKPVWVYFMASWCPSCRDELPLMNGLAARYGGDGLVVLAVDVHESETTAGTFARQMKTTFPVGVDADGNVAQAWRVVGLPVHFWIDPQGIVRDGALGGIGPDVMAAGLRTILPGVSVSP